MAETPTDIERITRYSVTKWRSIISIEIEKFESALKADDKDQFNQNYLEKLSEKSASIFKIFVKLSVLHSLITLSLFTLQYQQSFSIQLLGVSVRDIYKIKELILLLSTLISVAACSLQTYHAYIGKLLKALIANKFPEHARPFAAALYGENFFSYLQNNPFAGYSWKKGVALGIVISFVSFLAILIIVGALSIFIQLSVIVDAIETPALPGYVNVVVVILSIFALIYSLTLGIVQLPLPYTDFSNQKAIEALKTTDPDLHTRTVLRISKNEDRIRFRSYLFTCVFFFVIAAGLKALLSSTIEAHPVKFVMGLFLCAAIVPIAARQIHKISMKIFFRRPRDGSPKDIKLFTRVQKLPHAFCFLSSSVSGFFAL